VRTSADEHVLIDTGFPGKYTEDFHAASDEDRLYEFGEVLVCGPENLPTAQLARCDVAPESINLVIQTHTHIDHIGGIADFMQAPMLISAIERALPRPLYWGDVHPVDWPDRRYIQLEEDCDIGPDFSVMLVPGHAPGQLAMLLRLPETGPVLLTSDAISRPAEIDEKFAGSMDEAAAIKSAARLMTLAEAENAFIIYGHDPQQWDEIKKAPHTYI
jgi:N-acyl homoserine lactone hydrolase